MPVETSYSFDKQVAVSDSLKLLKKRFKFEKPLQSLVPQRTENFWKRIYGVSFGTPPQSLFSPKIL